MTCVRASQAHSAPLLEQQYFQIQKNEQPFQLPNSKCNKNILWDNSELDHTRREIFWKDQNLNIQLMTRIHHIKTDRLRHPFLCSKPLCYSKNQV